MEKERSGTGGRRGGGRERGEPLVLSGVCSLQGCIAKHHSTKAHQVRFGGPVEAEVFTGRIKKKAQRGLDWQNRCFGSSKALVPWSHHSWQVKQESGGPRGPCQLWGLSVSEGTGTIGSPRPEGILRIIIALY